MNYQLSGKPIGLFAKITRTDDEQRLVYGIVTDETPVHEWPGVDVDVITSHAATKRAVERWMKWGNIREMHQASAVGVARSVEFNDQTRETYVTAHIVDDQAWEKVKAGVYRGFSIAGPIKTWNHDKKLKRITITDYDLDEISLCDRPKNPETVIKLWQAVGVPPLQRSEPLWLVGGDPYLMVADDSTIWDEATVISDWLVHSTEGDRVNFAEYGRMFLLRDAANPETQEGYQLPFAAEAPVLYYEGSEPHEELACIPAALYAAVTVLQGMTDLSETTKRDVERRMERYYHAMNRKAPWEIQQSKTGGQSMDKDLWKKLMGEEAMPDDVEKAAELVRAKLAIPPATPPIEPALEVKRALDGIASIDAKLTTFEARLAKIEAMPVMPLVQRTGDPELSVDDQIAKLERTIKAQQLAPDAPEVIELQRLYQQKRSTKK
ncbi:MAG: hypothetical protein ACOYBO_01075 [Azonexus sp.]